VVARPQFILQSFLRWQKAVHYVIVHFIQYCSRKWLVCIVKLFGDAWYSLAAVIMTFASCQKSIQLVDVTRHAEAGPGLTRVCQLGCNDGSEDFLNTMTRTFLEDTNTVSRDLAFVPTPRTDCIGLIYNTMFFCLLMQAYTSCNIHHRLLSEYRQTNTHTFQWLLEYETSDFWKTLKLHSAFPVSQ